MENVLHYDKIRAETLKKHYTDQKTEYEAARDADAMEEGEIWQEKPAPAVVANVTPSTTIFDLENFTYPNRREAKPHEPIPETLLEQLESIKHDGDESTFPTRLICKLHISDQGFRTKNIIRHMVQKICSWEETQLNKASTQSNVSNLSSNIKTRSLNLYYC